MSHGSRATVPAAIANLATQVTDAAPRIRPVIVETPVEQIEGLVPNMGAAVFFKLENLQKTGSFKLRGASNKILSLSPSQAVQGVIAASNGNHGLGVAAAARTAGIAAEVYVSTHVSPTKARRIEEYGAHIKRIGNDPLEAELAARAAAAEQGKEFISP
jgi:threonine dehydratase